MKSLGKGWLEEYVAYRKELHINDSTIRKEKSSSPEHSLYRMVQPSGLMYGYGLHFEDEKNQELGEKDRMKILLAESLISSALLYNTQPIQHSDDFSRVILKTLDNVGSFYNNIFPELATSANPLFGRKKTTIEVAEKIIEKRIEQTYSSEGNFWSHFFHNSLLFLDVFIFGQWIHTNADKIVADFFRYQREELRFSVIKVIAAAANANRKIEVEEKKLLELFIQGAGLSSEKRKQATLIFDKGVDISEINLPAENSWILKKFFLEIAILTMWADRKVEQQEEDFLKQFSRHLGFSEDDLENSLIAIEGFVLEHWEQLEFLQNKQDYQLVSDHFIRRVSKIVEKNRNRLEREIADNAELRKLLEKGKTNELSAEENEKMREFLIGILRSIPTFVIVALPHKFLSLPVLLKILPKGIL